MEYLYLIFSKILDRTASEIETSEFISKVENTIEDSWDSWKKEKESLTEEEEEIRFIERMKNQGFTGKTNEEALLFLDLMFPNNIRRKNIEKRRLERLKKSA